MSRWRLVGTVAAFVAVALVVTATAVAAVGVASSGWTTAWFALSCVLAVLAVFVLTWRWRDVVTWLAVAGFLLVAAGSGISWSYHRNVPIGSTIREPNVEPVVLGRGEGQLWQGGGGDHLTTIESMWMFVLAGAAFLAYAVVASVKRRSNDRVRSLLASCWLTIFATSYVTIAVLLNDLVVLSWQEGRPIRRRRRRVPDRLEGRAHAAAWEHWLDAADDEAESVVAFSELAVRLEGLEAPADLVRRCQRAAVQERRHVVCCERLAWAFGGPATSPSVDARIDTARHRAGPRSRYPGVRAEVIHLALESWVDGVLGEGFAARRLEAGATTVAGPHGALLRSIAAEERDHAHLSADIVDWLATSHPVLVRTALRRCARRVRASCSPMGRVGLSPRELRRAGFADHVAAEELWQQERRAALERVERLLCSGRGG